MVDLVILRTEEVGLVSVDVIVFDVVTKVVVATSGADDVTDGDWLCVVTEEVVVVTPRADDVADKDWLPVVTEEVVVATSRADDVADEDWLPVVTEEVVVVTPGAEDVADELWLRVATPGADDVADELWLCVVTDTEVVAATPGTDNDVLMPRVVVVVELVVDGMEAGLFSLKIISSLNDIILFNVPTP